MQIKPGTCPKCHGAMARNLELANRYYWDCLNCGFNSDSEAEEEWEWDHMIQERLRQAELAWNPKVYAITNRTKRKKAS